MIRFSLACDKDHDFDGWFGSSDDFETQQKRGLIACPVCQSTKVDKTLMAPQVATSRKKEAVRVGALQAAQNEALAELKKMRDTIVANSEDVGDRFPEEVRKIHYGESEERGIIGEASKDDVEELLDEGIEVAPLPILPGDAN